MSHTLWYESPLTCCNCKCEISGRQSGMYSSDLLIDRADRSATPGDRLEIERLDFDEAFVKLREPAAAVLTVIEQWHCPQCNAAQWAKITFKPCGETCYELVAVESVPLSESLLQQVHFVSYKLLDWLQDNPGTETDKLSGLITAARAGE